MKNQKNHPPLKQRYVLPLRGTALVVVLSVPLALYKAAQAGNHPVLWGLLGVMVLAMVLAIWAG